MTLDSTTRPSSTLSDSLFRQVTERLAVAIISGTYGTGELIPNEAGLGHELTVSRTAYREALKFLSGKGLIDARPRSGTRVAARATWNLLDPDVLRWSLAADPDETFIADLFELRIIVEPQAARFAAERRLDSHLAQIESALIGMETAPAYTEANFAADLAFHELIFEAAGNTALSRLKSVVGTTLLWAMRLQSGNPQSKFVIPLQDHRRLFEAIAARDSALATSLSTTLVIEAKADTMATFRAHKTRATTSRK